jgi:hypothetical protein
MRLFKLRKSIRSFEQVTIKNRMISPFQLCFFAVCAGNSFYLRLKLRWEPSMCQGLSNGSKFVKIGRLELEIWVNKEIASKWKIYISKLKPVKGIEGLIKIQIGQFEKSLFRHSISPSSEPTNCWSNVVGLSTYYNLVI